MSLLRLLGLFLRIGTIGFGGGMAVIALMERELVDERRLIPADQFLHGVGLGQVLGPFAVNAAFFVGYRRHGFLGGLASAVAFLLPSISAVIALSALYFRYHHVPALAGALAGLGPVVIALILSAAWSMGRKALRTWPAAVLAVVGLAAGMVRVNAVWVLVAAGMAGLLIGRQRLSVRADRGPAHAANAPNDAKAKGGLSAILPFVPATSLSQPGLTSLLLVFTKVGLGFFGGGFVLIAILRQHLVDDLHWLTPREFLDGVAISNLTPGPIAVLATFAGYKLQGVGGAVAATVGLLMPALVLMTLFSALYSRFQNSRRLHDFMAGVSPVVVGLVASAALLLWRSGVPTWRALALMLIALMLLVRWRWHPAFVLALGAAAALLGWVP